MYMHSKRPETSNRLLKSIENSMIFNPEEAGFMTRRLYK